MSINAASKSTSALGDASVIDFAQQTVEQFQHDDDNHNHASPTDVAVYQRHSPPLTFQISDVAIQQPASDFWVGERWREAMGSLPGNKSIPHCLPDCSHSGLRSPMTPLAPTHGHLDRKCFYLDVHGTAERLQDRPLARVTVQQTMHHTWGLIDNLLCSCGQLQTMSHIVNVCPSTKFPGGLRALHCADDNAAEWLDGRCIH